MPRKTAPWFFFCVLSSGYLAFDMQQQRVQMAFSTTRRDLRLNVCAAMEVEKMVHPYATAYRERHDVAR